MPDREFKVMIIKVLSRLQRKVEDITEILDKEIKMSVSKIKNSINEMKNTIDGINRRLQETEECINGLEDRVIESNQAEPVRDKY